MKTIGLIGGMSWQSTNIYYSHINNLVNEKLGANNNAKILLYSLNFEDIQKEQIANNWEKLAKIILDAALILEHAGADCILICANTMHKVYPQIRKKIKIPIIHIAKATAFVCNQRQLSNKKVALLGTKYTMSQDFIKSVLVENGLEVIVPIISEQDIIHNIIINQLCKGIISQSSFQLFKDIAINLHQKGADGIVLGCTEIPLLINQSKFQQSLTEYEKSYMNLINLNFYDTTQIHSEAAVKFALTLK